MTEQALTDTEQAVLDSMLRLGGTASAEDIADDTGMTEERVSSVMYFLRKMGMVEA
jgi:uncharacterized membrane protein